MISMEAECVGNRHTRGRELKTAAVAEQVRRARRAVRRVGRSRNCIKAATHRDLFGEDQLYRPAGKRRGAGIGDAYVDQEEITRNVGW
jgi:hypothetical protein